MSKKTVTFKVNSIIYDALISEVDRTGTSKNALMSEILTNYANENLQLNTCSFAELSETLNMSPVNLIEYTSIFEEAAIGGKYVTNLAIELMEESRESGVLKAMALMFDHLKESVNINETDPEQIVYYSKADINILAGNSRVIFTMKKMCNIIKLAEPNNKLLTRHYRSLVDGNWCDNMCIGVTYNDILKFKFDVQ